MRISPAKLAAEAEATGSSLAPRQRPSQRSSPSSATRASSSRAQRHAAAAVLCHQALVVMGALERRGWARDEARESIRVLRSQIYGTLYSTSWARFGDCAERIT